MNTITAPWRREHVVIEQHPLVRILEEIEHPPVVVPEERAQGDRENPAEEKGAHDHRHVHQADPLVIQRKGPAHEPALMREIIIF